MIEYPSDRVGKSCTNYALKLSKGRGAARRDGDVEAQAAHYATAQQRMGLLRAMTAQVLDSHGVGSIVRPFYYSFILKLARLVEEFSYGESCRIEAMLQLDLWTARGLARDVLIEIAYQVLNMDLGRPACDPCGAVEKGVESNRG